MVITAAGQGAIDPGWTVIAWEALISVSLGGGGGGWYSAQFFVSRD